MRAKSWKFIAGSFLCLGVTGYAIWGYGTGEQRAPIHPEMAVVFDAHRTLITTHAVAASFALLLGPFQFLDRWRAEFPKIHRLLGYLYLTLGVGVGGIAGLMLAPHSFGGFVSRLGFGSLACIWLFSGIRALIAAKKRCFEEHRRWMIRNFALSLAAVALRIYLPVSVAAGIPFEKCYPVIAWLGWIPNLILAEGCCKIPKSSPESLTPNFRIQP